MRITKTLVPCIVVGVLSACGGGDDAPPILAPLPQAVPSPVYGVIGTPGPHSQLVVVLAADESSTLNDPATSSGIVPLLLSAGYSVLSMDLPCHGADATPEDGSPLYCWALRIASGDNQLFLQFCANLSAVLDTVGADAVSIVGISRGGYVALTCAAYDSRIKYLDLLSPVTDLNYLIEFQDYPVDEMVFNVAQYEPYLRKDRAFIRISTNDTRVGTPGAIALAQAIGATLELVPGTLHTPAEDGSSITWLNAQTGQ